MKYYPSSYFKYLYHKVDNITAKYNGGYWLPLQKIALCLTSCNYNTERFPGFRIKSKKSAVIIFESAILNILGYSTNEEIESRWQTMRQILQIIVKKNMT